MCCFCRMTAFGQKRTFSTNKNGSRRSRHCNVSAQALQLAPLIGPCRTAGLDIRCQYS